MARRASPSNTGPPSDLVGHFGSQLDTIVIQVGGIHSSRVPAPSAPRKTGYGEEIQITCQEKAHDYLERKVSNRKGEIG